jgi:hypothetical protein
LRGSAAAMKSKNRKRLPVSAFGLISLLSIEPIYGDQIVDPKLIEIEKDFVTQCVQLSLIDRIKLSRTPERRKQRSIECNPDVWLRRSWTNAIDPSYLSSKIEDAKFRQDLESWRNSSLIVEKLNRNNQETTEHQILTAGGDTKTATESEKPNIETVRNYVSTPGK